MPVTITNSVSIGCARCDFAGGRVCTAGLPRLRPAEPEAVGLLIIFKRYGETPSAASAATSWQWRLAKNQLWEVEYPLFSAGGVVWVSLPASPLTRGESGTRSMAECSEAREFRTIINAQNIIKYE